MDRNPSVQTTCSLVEEEGVDVVNTAFGWAGDGAETVGPERNGLVMLFVGMGKTLFRGLILGALGIMDACI